jgi:hypothetical protein
MSLVIFVIAGAMLIVQRRADRAEAGR